MNLHSFSKYSHYPLVFTLCLWVLPAGTFAVCPDATGATSLLARIDEALAKPQAGNMNELLDDIETYLLSTANPPHEFTIKAHFLKAVAHLRRNEIQSSWAQLEASRPLVHKAEFPELHFRYHSLRAALLLAKGDARASAQEHGFLLQGRLSEISPLFVNRAKVNWAAALHECGQTQSAIKIYEKAMLSALETEADPTALHAGNNLLALLIDQKDLEGARQNLTLLEKAIERQPNSFGARSLRLRELELLNQEGETKKAIAHLLAFLNNETLPSLLQGAAHKLLARASIDQGNLDAALHHGQQAVTTLENRANELPDALLVLAEVHLARKDYGAALQELRKIDVAAEMAPLRVRKVSQLKLQALLMQEEAFEAEEILQDLIASNARHDQLVSQTRADYREANIAAIQNAEQVKYLQKLALADREREAAEDQMLMSIAAVIGIAVITSFLVVIQYFRRKNERIRHHEQIVQNQVLEKLVAERTRELASTIDAKAELAAALERKKRMESIGLLAGNVAHDINNLLQVISNANETLTFPNLTQEDRENALDISNDSVTHGAGIIRQLLAYSRQADLASRPHEFELYLSENLSLFKSFVGDRIELAVRCECEDYIALFDPAQLTTTILNILSNAVDSMPDGGHIQLRCEPVIVEPEQLEWSEVEPGDYLRVAISDSGVGMESDELAQVFEPFYSTKSPETGSGLGLSSAYGFIKQSGGDIRITSEKGQGTTVEFLLPRAMEQEADDLEEPIHSLVEPSRRRILLVEDHDSVAESLINLLEQLDLKVQRAISGCEARELLQLDSAFDLVLSDVQTPGSMSGLDLAHWIQHELPELRVALMSGYNDIVRADYSIPLLPKPFNYRQLHQFLSKILDGPRHAQ